ncbi:MAG: superfamily II DNA or RNA helicase/HKD family nuclease [Psychroserpens sp.]|jgi:superfamily II DNA or RNA helicase/HKD family nuclease
MKKDVLDLKESIITGFVDQSHASNHLLQPEFLSNNRGLKVLTTIKEQLLDCDEFWFSVAFITTSGLASLKQELLELKRTNIKGKILVSQYLNFSQPEALKQLLCFENIELRIAVDTDFHAKGYMFSKDEIHNIIVGSSNFTANALTSNKEWNLKVSAYKDSHIYHQALSEFSHEFESATPVTKGYIDNYEQIYLKQRELSIELKKAQKGLLNKKIQPNGMQIEALSNLQSLRDKGKTKALLVSATGTGKTYLSAFDAYSLQPKRLLFVVHRANIAKAAMETYKTIFGSEKSFGLYSGNSKDLDKDFVFSTVQTISKHENLKQFQCDAFDYIVIDETHRASANSYQKILNHFTPSFLLGMTATPERTDGLDVFGLFDHNLAYEIRLHKALEMKILSPFHYYGVTDISVDGKLLDESADFTKLVSKERVKHIIDKISLYGCDNGDVRGLVFCSNIDECVELSHSFNLLGLRSIALASKNSEDDRNAAIEKLESSSDENKIDYIFSVDIFNEGIDIPLVNQVVMLRPTQSSIIFVQQLGRGLRKANNKDYLTVIDFIGNYKNNFLVPIALYGDTSYNKDNLRKMISSGSSEIPGSSTVNFESVAKERIYKAIDATNLKTKRELKKDYDLLKYKLGYSPMMIDFLEHGSRDPFAYVEYSKSFYDFSKIYEKELKDKILSKQLKLLQLLSSEINNAKRVEESLILKALLVDSCLNLTDFKEHVLSLCGYVINDESVKSFINNLNLNFVTEKVNNKYQPVGTVNDFNIVILEKNEIKFHRDFVEHLLNETFKKFLIDSVDYSIKVYCADFKPLNYFDGFHLYRKYSRKDVFRILKWDKNPVALNVGGYVISNDKTNCALFVNYHKEEGISDTIKYEDSFINEFEFLWMSKLKRTLDSPEIQAMREYHNGLRLPLFIKKSNGEGDDFYYMGDVTPKEKGFEETSILTKEGKPASVVKVKFEMKVPVEHGMYKYLLAN